MKFKICFLLIFQILIINFILVGCDSKAEKRVKVINSNFDYLVSYCESNNKFNSDSDCYKLSWRDNDLNKEFTANIFKDKKVEIFMTIKEGYNNYIDIKYEFYINFYYGSENNNQLKYYVSIKTTMISLKSAYNYYETVLDEDYFYDSQALFDITSFTSSCSYEKYDTRNNAVSYPDPNSDLEEFSNDCFFSLDKYFRNTLNIKLFV